MLDISVLEFPGPILLGSYLPPQHRIFGLLGCDSALVTNWFINFPGKWMEMVQHLILCLFPSKFAWTVWSYLTQFFCGPLYFSDQPTNGTQWREAWYRIKKIRNIILNPIIDFVIARFGLLEEVFNCVQESLVNDVCIDRGFLQMHESSISILYMLMYFAHVTSN